MRERENEINISDIPDNKGIDDYPDDTIFVFDDKPVKRDPNTGLVIRE